VSGDTVRGGRWPLAVVPEWLFDRGDVSDGAIRLYCVLERLAQRDGHARPLRKTLAERLGWSTSKVDRTIESLTAVGAVRVEHQYRAGTRIRQGSHYYLAGPEPFPVDTADALTETLLAEPPRVVTDDDMRPHPRVVTDDDTHGEGLYVGKTQESPNGDSDAPVTGVIGADPAEAKLNPGAVYHDACRAAGYTPLTADTRGVASVAKRALAQHKPPDLVRRTCEVLAERNCGASYFARVLAELERNGHERNGQGTDAALVRLWGQMWHEQWLTYCAYDDPLLDRSRIPDINGTPKEGGERWRLIVSVMRHYGGDPAVIPTQLMYGISAFMVDPKAREEGWDADTFLRHFERWVDKATRPLSAQ
jgi:hypothetical protein